MRYAINFDKLLLSSIGVTSRTKYEVGTADCYFVLFLFCGSKKINQFGTIF